MTNLMKTRIKSIINSKKKSHSDKSEYNIAILSEKVFKTGDILNSETIPLEDIFDGEAIVFSGTYPLVYYYRECNKKMSIMTTSIYSCKLRIRDKSNNINRMLSSEGLYPLNHNEAYEIEILFKVL